MGDLGEALAAMNGAHRSFRTLRATVHRRHDEETVQLSVERPERLRVERLGGSLRAPAVGIVDGKRWWTYDLESGVASNEDEPEVQSGIADEWLLLLDPAGLIGACSFEALGRVKVAGREAILLRATPLEEEVESFAFHQLGLGGDAYGLAVDAERGILLRSIAFLEGEEVDRLEVREVAFDEELPPETFALSLPPGERVRPVAATRAETVTLDEAARRAPFLLWYPRDVAEGWLTDVSYFPGDERWPEPPAVTVHLRREDAPYSLTILERASGTDAHDDWGLEETWKEVEHYGEVFEVATSAHRRGGRRVRFEREGTLITLASGDFPLEALLELVLHMRPVDGSS